MDHVVYVDARANELENLILGNKSMIIRGAAGRKIPYGRVNQGDVLYFINNNGEGKVKATGVVTTVLNSDKLSEEESFETIIRHQDRLQLPDDQFERWAGKRYLVLIGIDNVHKIEPFSIDKNDFANTDDWIPVGKIEDILPATAKTAIR